MGFWLDKSSTFSRPWIKSLTMIINSLIWLRLVQKYSELLYYSAYVSTFAWWCHWLLSKFEKLQFCRYVCNVWKVFQRKMFENNNIIASQWDVNHSNRASVLEIRAIPRLDIGRKQESWSQQEISAIPYRVPPGREILQICKEMSKTNF